MSDRILSILEEHVEIGIYVLWFAYSCMGSVGESGWAAWARVWEHCHPISGSA